MLGSGHLTAVLPPDGLYPADAAFMARTNLVETRMLGFTALQLDTVTSIFAGLLGSRAAVRHEACAGDEVFAVYRRAGFSCTEETLTYRTAEEAEALGDALVARGRKLFWPYPLRAGRFPDTAHLTTPELYRRLNAKELLGSLTPAENLPSRRTLSHEELATFEPEAPVFLKAAGVAATGWGYAVRPCPDRATYAEAREWFAVRRADIPAVIVEEAVDLECCWCAGLAVGDRGATCFGGAEQLFSEPAHQSGSIIDPERPFPREGVALAARIGSAAGVLGFRGVAGLDIGLARDGRLLVFDPNFRVNASTSQLLFHEAASTRTGLPASRSLQAAVGGPFAALAARLAGPVAEGRFVPTRLFNGEKHPLSGGKHLVTGFVLGRNRKEAADAAQKLEAGLAG
jgi:hypothetical protein